MSAIKAGDLVMVVKPSPCCGGTSGIGHTFVVAEVLFLADGVCWRCRKQFSDTIACFGTGASGGYGPQLSRLIRIDPPALPESVETDREVTA